ncbi:sigma-70 family RNA polymerase sigma factor, partial [Kitasatospora sp. NPDC094015]|uniref:sigma-70 family RNA polymerase sigma factor n=1 Tax=Kitasatospora sp. NPDC094015 TaxID=3155205 RepID=UPI003325D11F
MNVIRSSFGPPPRGEELQELVAKVAVGDHDAYRTLYRAVVGPVFGIVRRVLRDPAQAEEVAQEVMLEVWRTAARYRPDRGAVLTWVLTVAHHRAVDRVRYTEATAARDRRAAAHFQATPFDEVVEEVEDRLECERVRHCLRGLTDLQRQSLTLAYYQGKTCREVADLLGAPLST